MPKYDRRGFLRLTGAAAATSALASACSGSSLDDSENAGDGGSIKIGLILPEGGVYKALGDDQRAGWNLYLELNKKRLGGRDITVVTADESEDAETTKANAEKLLKKDNCLVVAGMISSANIIPVQDMFTEAKVPFLSTNASPGPVQGKKFGWRSSFKNADPTLAIAPYMAKNAGGPISMIAANYAAGQDHVKALDQAFKAAGGKLAGDPILTPFPMTVSFQPYLKQIEDQNPKAVYCFFGGADAVKFVKEYQKFGLSEKYQLFAPGWLTEGGVLNAQGPAAEGILNSLNYSADLDNAANRKFVAEYQRKNGRAPTSFAVAAYDAGWILDKAIAAAGGDLTSERLEKEIGEIGQIDSPRGPWEFGEHRSPVQKWYLREVKKDGDVLANVVIDELSTVGID
ncbi:MAG TPA: ABC transporter substrate-binding protein [Micromonosporaceae bacterium]